MKRLTLPFNINHEVLVRLTDKGRKIVAEDPDGAYPYTEDENGWSKWQLWVLMQVFGQHCWNGVKELPFETEIKVIHE